MAGSLIQPGAFNLGAILAGGSRERQDAKTTEEMRLMQQASLQAETDRRVDEARMAAMKRTGQEGVRDDPSLSPLMRALTLGDNGASYAGATQGQLHQQDFDVHAAAQKAALAGNLDQANENLYGVANGPVAQTVVQDGQVIRTPQLSTAAVTPTDVSRALAGQHDAAARLSNVKADAGGFAPSRARAGDGQPTPPSGELFKSLLGDGIGGVAPSKAASFERYQAANAAHDPRFNNGNYALQQYASGHAAPTGEMQDFGAGPVSMHVGENPDAIRALTQVLRDRHARGLPEWSDAQKRQAIRDYTVGKPISAVPQTAPVAAAPAGLIGRIMGAFGGGDAAAAPAEAGLPPQAAAQLQPGHETKFGNGQVWTLQGGKPLRVR